MKKKQQLLLKLGNFKTFLLHLLNFQHYHIDDVYTVYYSLAMCLRRADPTKKNVCTGASTGRALRILTELAIYICILKKCENASLYIKMS